MQRNTKGIISRRDFVRGGLVYTKMRKLLSVMITFVLVVGMLPCEAFAQDVAPAGEDAAALSTEPVVPGLESATSTENGADIEPVTLETETVAPGTESTSSDLKLTAVPTEDSEDAATPTREEAELKTLSDENITERERIAQINELYKKSNPDKDIPTTISLEEGTYIQDGQIHLTQWTFSVYDSEGALYKTYITDLTGSHLDVADDVVLIEEKEDDWFSGAGPLAVGGPSSAVYSNIELTEGVPVLILETNGDLHGFYAAAGTNSNTLVLGEPMNVFRGVTGGHFENHDVYDELGYDFGPTFPLPPVAARWGDHSLNYFTTDLLNDKGYLHFDFDFDSGFGWVELDADDISLEFAYKNNYVDLEEENDWSYSKALFTAGGDLAGVLDFDASAFINFEGGGQGETYFDTNIKEGYYVGLKCSLWDGIDCTKVGWIDDRNFDITDTNAEGEFYISYGEGVSIKVLETLGLGADYKAGFVIEGEKSKNHEYPGEPDVWHACEDEECICGKSHIRFGPLALNLELWDWSETLAHTDPADLDPFMYYYVSDTFGDKNMRGKCPHKGYKINAEVVDTAGNKLPDVTVSYADVPEHFEPVSSATTDEDGKALLYAPTGDYNVTAELVNKTDPSVKVSQTLPLKKDTTIQDMKFTLDIPTKHVYFKNSQPGNVKNWPKDIDFQPVYSEDVQLPSTAPQISGYQFVGWNTKQDGSGTSYAPGEKLTLKDDLTLWAQWDKAENVWYVVYDANGGTKAPDTQIVAQGKNAVLSKDRPEFGGMTFKGWRVDPTATEPEYQPGDTLAYKADVNVVVLHAMWELSPVGQPVHITYDANGMQGAGLPADVWVEADTWIHLGKATPPIGSGYVHKGWSTEEGATIPQYLPGHDYCCLHDETMYAVWGESKHDVTLTFEDSTAGDATGIPEPITIVPSASHDVRIPDQIPQKSGMQFTGWNTAQDGSGDTYAPGSVFKLTEDTTLWAQWDKAENVWYVVYDANGGTKAPDTQVVEQGHDAVLSDELPEAGTMTFRGWTTDPSAAEVEYQPGDTLAYDADSNVVVLYALWELSPAPRPVHVTFNANGLSGARVPADVWLESDGWIQLAAAVPPLGSEYAFRGWSKSAIATEPDYYAGKSYHFDHDTALYAVWGIQDTVTLTFGDPLPGKATGIPDPISIESSMSPNVRIPDQIPQKSGMQFTGWNTAEDGSGDAYAPGSVFKLTEDTVLWAQWDKAENVWYVVYDANGGTKAPKTQIVTKGQDAVLSTENPEFSGMTFKGWTPDLNAKKPVYQPGDTLPYNADTNVVVLYALWELSPQPRPIHITYDANGVQGARVPSDVWTESGSWVQLAAAAAPLGSSYVFLGWSKDSGAEEPEYLAGKSYRFGHDTTLYAVWGEQETVTLTFEDSTEGDATGIPEPITIVPSMSRDVRIPSVVPQKGGMQFTGWNTAKDGSGDTYAPGAVITLERDTTLWVQWDKAESVWYVVYDANGGTWAPQTQIVEHGQDAVLSDELPEAGSMTFKGWATDPDAAEAEYQPGDTLPYDSSKNVVVLYALWELSPAQRPVIVSFDANGGLPDTAPKAISIPKNVWSQLPEQQPSWDAQHDFLGWSTNSGATSPEWASGATVLFDKDTTLYAVWYPHYKVIEGAGSTWTKGSGKTQRFVADGNIKYFTELKIDGKKLSDDVTFSSGSTIADISADAMEKLSVGDHTVTFVYMDGTASAPFKVDKQSPSPTPSPTPLPKTGDGSYAALWSMLIVSLMCLGAAASLRRRKS